MDVSFENVDEQPTLRFERRIGHSVQTVWEAVTQPAELAHWFPCEVEVDLRLGGKMKFHFPELALPDQASTLLGEVTELDPPTRFSFLWGEDHLHFALEPVEDGLACMLRFSVELDARDKAARDGAGWHVCLDALERLLDGAAVERPYKSEEWRAHYQEYERRGFPTGAEIPQNA
jgi:uncharacterized protein YndB with AHSA1/START domain